MVDDTIKDVWVDEKKEIDVKSWFVIVGILIFALAVCFGLLFWQNYQQEKQIGFHSEWLSSLDEAAISYSSVGLMCVDQNCTIKALVITNNTENR